MTGAQPRPAQSKALAFLQPKLDELTIKPKPCPQLSWTGQPFIRSRRLREWLRGQTKGYAEDVCNAEVLLDRIYGSTEWEINLDAVLDGEDSCAMALCVLIELDQAHHIHKLHYHGLRDNNLPMLVCNLRTLMCDALEDSTHAIKLAEEFDNKQWAYFPVNMANDTSEALSPRHILPICMRQPIKKGGTAQIVQIAVPNEFVPEEMRQVVSSSRFEASHGFGPCYLFALKVFRGGREQAVLYEAERTAYIQFKNQDHLVRCLGAFTIKEAQDLTHNILLEYGDYDLSEHFWSDPPAFSEHIHEFWSALFGVVDGIRDIHHFVETHLDERVAYVGWHADIKPSNILRVQGKYKLADPGFAGVRRLTDHLKNGRRVNLLGRTTTYGAPESHRSGSIIEDPVAFDMWSLGCVFSEAATWVVLGNSGCDAYRNHRHDAISQLNLKLSTADNDAGQGDWFHDGKEVLQEVRTWHLSLRDLVRPSDPITKKVLDIVDHNLLVGDPAKRMQASDLSDDLHVLDEEVKALIGPFTSSSMAKAIAASREKQVSLVDYGSESV